MNAILRGHHKILAALLFIACLFVTTNSNAHGWGGGWHGGGWGGGWHGGGWHGGWGGWHGAGWHGGGWHGGGWGGNYGWGGWGSGIYISPVFYSQPYYRTCGLVGGHWHHRHWIPAHRVCWY